MSDASKFQHLTVTAAAPAMVSLTVTSRCNLRCVMCHHSQSRIKKQDISDEVITKLAGHMQSASAIDLTGLGEAWLSRQFRPILEMFPVGDDSQDSDYKISFNCNGTRFNDADIDLLLSTGVRKIRISIDAADPERFMAIRGVELETVLTETRRLVAARRASGRRYPLIGIQMTLMKGNLDNVRDMVDLATGLGADFFDIWSLNELETDMATNWTVGAFNYEEQKISHIPQDQLDALTDDVHAHAAGHALPLFTAIHGKSRWSEGYPGEDWGKDPDVAWKPESIRCPLPWQVLRSHYDGEVHSCCWGTQPIADLRQSSAEEAWNGENIRAMRANLIDGRIPEQCSGAGCPYVLGRTRGDQRADEVRALSALELNLFNELLTQEIMHKYARPGAVVIDAGANEGVHTRLLSDLVQAEGRVHAFEPNPKLLGDLANLAANVRVWPMAVGDELGVRAFFVPDLDDEQASLTEAYARRSGHDVRVHSVIEVRLDDLPEVTGLPVSLVKIDVEGHELQALSGMRALLERDHPVVVYENNTEAINQFWSTLGYTVYFPAEDQRLATPNVVALPPFSGDRPAGALVEDAEVDRLLDETRRRLTRGGDRLIDRIAPIEA